jgi:class 3 adenylate cyclase
MFVEIDGFAELTSSDERLAIELLGEYASIALPLIPEHGGKVFDSVADQLLVVFDSALQSLQCALQLQLVCKARNATVEPGRAIWPRIGIHLGEIWIDDARVYGNGVNIAARVLAEAEGGLLLISEDVYHQVANKLESGFERLEARTLKNIERPIGLWRVLNGCERPTAAVVARQEGLGDTVVSRGAAARAQADVPGPQTAAGRGSSVAIAREEQPVVPVAEPAEGAALSPSARDAIDRFVEELRTYEPEEIERMVDGSLAPPGSGGGVPMARVATSIPAAPTSPTSPSSPSSRVTVRFGASEIGSLVSSLLSDESARVDDVLRKAADELDGDPERLAALGKRMRGLERKLQKLERLGVLEELGKLGDLARLSALADSGVETELGDAARMAATVGRRAAIEGERAAIEGRIAALEAKGQMRRALATASRVRGSDLEDAIESRIEAKLEARLGDGDVDDADEGFSPERALSATEREWGKMESRAQKDVSRGAIQVVRSLVLGGACAAGYFFLGASVWWMVAGAAIGAIPFLSGLSKLLRAATILRSRRKD